MATKKESMKKTHAETRPYITSITLGGFQVFDEPTTIPLGRLTFLFGPNSAGKSAVEDALIFLSGALGSSAVGIHNGPTDSQRYGLQRHWRRVDGKIGHYAPVLTLGFTANIPTNLAGAVAGNLERGRNFSPAASNRDGHEIDVTLRHRLHEHSDEYDEIFASCDFSLGVDGQELLRLEENVRMGVNFAHPLLSGIKLTTDYQALAASLPEHVCVKAGWVWLHSTIVKFDHSHYLNNIDREAFIFNLAGSKPGSPRIQEMPDLERRLRPALEELSDYFDTIRFTALSNMSANPNLVSASRTIPTAEDLTCLCTRDTYSNPLEHFDLLPNSNSKYCDVAESFIHANFREAGVPFFGDSRPLLAGVNRALSDHLFLDRGYRLDADFRVVLDLDQFSKLKYPEFSEAGNYPILVQMYLVDSQGRHFSFDEVGSGLGYVLPVLCSVFHPRVSVSLLQQPELHLHPALQAALGDVLIEASGDEKQLIIETHSEHLLLRVLKRIRQTATNNPPVSELQLQPEDVSVVYFDPNPDGTTKVKRLRISPDGDFLDLWPRGFFAERDQELFDE